MSIAKVVLFTPMLVWCGTRGARGGGGESGAGAQAAQGAQRCRRRARGCLEGREPATQHCERTAERLRCVGRYLSI